MVDVKTINIDKKMPKNVQRKAQSIFKVHEHLEDLEKGVNLSSRNPEEQKSSFDHVAVNKFSKRGRLQRLKKPETESIRISYVKKRIRKQLRKHKIHLTEVFKAKLPKGVVFAPNTNLGFEGNAA